MQLTITVAFAFFLTFERPTPIEGSDLLAQLSLIYKDTYVVYGAGRRSERDLPVCESSYEACNLAHERLWLTPVTERLCRCLRRTECPLSYEKDAAGSLPPDSQHVSNRAQLKFCENLDDTFEICPHGHPALELTLEIAQNEQTEGVTTRTSLFCRCPWPNAFVLNKTTTINDNKYIQIYVCNELPRCSTEELCGYVRRDTYEVYYTCSCPENHVCIFRMNSTTSIIDNPFHFQGESYEAVCTPK